MIMTENLDTQAIADDLLEDEIVADESGSDEGGLDLPENHRQAVMQQKNTSLHEYHRLYLQGRLKLNPDWQRAYVWKGKRPSLLIESLLMQIPIPVVFLARTPDEDLEVIDGVQRLTTIFNFFNSEFKLKGLEAFPELNGKTFSQLDKRIQHKLEDSVITSFELSSNTSQDLKFTTFERINTGGMSLNEMEIRNCIYRGKLNSKIQELAKNNDFVRCVNMRNMADRMFDRALVLRFLAFDNVKYERATSGIKSFLNRFFETHREANESILEDFENRFKRAMRNCYTVFGENSFRIRKRDRMGGGEWSTQANAAIFQVISTSFAAYDSAQIAARADMIMEEYIDVLDDSTWIDSVTKSTGDTKKIKYAFDTWNRRLENLMRGVEGLDTKRLFSLSLKKELYEANNTCAICGNEIKSLADSAVDHVEQYWRGGATIPTNARLAHRACNGARPLDN
ncbi:GmrSD restriction endonuclease domain-containing protein [Brucella intermedia]|uniref:GmrSD restriction endonuclease domain-containing protein n=1 Tax=Brucella intermedia TaxID=94625 RepID=UPI000EFAFAB9|nr:DUF262 domain-containing protein [Brucella intermedia]KAB2720390.1 DUF262 domain-containing protein [Brucella intermedia]